MQKSLKVFLGCLLATCPLIAAAATTTAEQSEAKWELSGGTTFGLDITTQSGQDSTKTWVFTSKAGYYVAPQIQVGADVTYYNYDQSSISGHYFAFLLGPTFDFTADAENAPYAFAGIGEASAGATYTSGSYTSTLSLNQFAYAIGIGKRFRLADHVTWAPQIRYLALDSANDGSLSVRASHDWDFLVFRFSVLF
ncbi:MAG: outer membrane beta-barrel protein [Bdellovibrionales bacterium]|nr:outer membrane beta-barrel protein [Bdellovibrionales bacterium]